MIVDFEGPLEQFCLAFPAKHQVITTFPHVNDHSGL